MEKYGKFIEMAVELGAKDARIIKTDSIVTPACVRWSAGKDAMKECRHAESARP